MLSTTEIKSPSPNQMKTLTLTDLVIMNKLSVSFREQIEKYVDVDPFTTHDPFHENDDYEYSLILDKTNTSRVVSILGFFTWQSICTSNHIKDGSWCIKI